MKIWMPNKSKSCIFSFGEFHMYVLMLIARAYGGDWRVCVSVYMECAFTELSLHYTIYVLRQTCRFLYKYVCMCGSALCYKWEKEKKHGSFTYFASQLIFNVNKYETLISCCFFPHSGIFTKKKYECNAFTYIMHSLFWVFFLYEFWIYIFFFVACSFYDCSRFFYCVAWEVRSKWIQKRIDRVIIIIWNLRDSSCLICINYFYVCVLYRISFCFSSLSLFLLFASRISFHYILRLNSFIAFCFIRPYHGIRTRTHSNRLI